MKGVLLNKPKSVSRIIGIIDLGNADPHVLHESEQTVTLKQEVCGRNGQTCQTFESTSPNAQRDVVVYQANLSELTRHLRQETNAFQSLYARIKSIDEASL